MYDHQSVRNHFLAQKRNQNMVSESSALFAFFTWFLIGTWVFTEIRMWWKSRRFKDTGDFDLTSQESTNLNSAQRRSGSANQNIAKTRKQIASLNHKGRNLRRNKTGEFDRRSALGKKLNKDLRRVQSLALRYENELIQAESEVEELLALPSIRARPWIRGEAYRISVRLSLIGLTVSVYTVSLFHWNHQLLIMGVWAALFLCISTIYRKHLSNRLGF